MASDFKFGAKLKLFGEHDIVIQPNPDHPFLIEYHDDAGIGVTREKISEKLNITNETIKSMIPEQTRVTDFVLDRKSRTVEVGVVIEPGDDFVLNKYKDIFEIEEISLFYHYDPQSGHQVNVNVEGHADVDTIKEKVVETAIDAINENTALPEGGNDEEPPTEDDVDPPLEEDELPEE